MRLVNGSFERILGVMDLVKTLVAFAHTGENLRGLFF